MSEHIKVELDFIPVEERLPEDSQWVMAQLGPSSWIGAYRFNGTWWYAHGPTNLEVKWPISHWAEIPVIKR